MKTEDQAEWYQIILLYLKELLKDKDIDTMMTMNYSLEEGLFYREKLYKEEFTTTNYVS